MWSSMNDWVNVRLGDLIDIKHGFAFRGEFFAPEPPGDLLMTPGNFAIGGGFQWGKSKYYRGPVPDEYILRPGDLIVTMTDLSKEADTLGYAAIVPNHNARLLHNQRIGKVVVRSVRASPLFLYWMMRSHEYRNEILASVTGSTVKHTSPTKILAFQFALPNLDEQSAIASILGALDDKIDLNRRMNETLEAMARAIFQDWFVTFGPTRAKQEGRPPYLAPDLWSLFPNRLDDDGKPEGWQAVPLDQIAEFLNGLALQKYPGTGVSDLPVIKIAQLRAGHADGGDWASSAIPPQYVVEDGDVLFSWSGSLIQRVWTGGPGALNQHLFKVTSTRWPKWLHYFWVDHHLPTFQSIAASKATTMGHIQRHHLSEAETVLGPQAVMDAANEIIAPLFQRMIANAIESRTLAATRDLLLPKLMSGELRVKDAERLAEAAL